MFEKHGLFLVAFNCFICFYVCKFALYFFCMSQRLELITQIEDVEEEEIVSAPESSLCKAAAEFNGQINVFMLYAQAERVPLVLPMMMGVFRDSIGNLISLFRRHFPHSSNDLIRRIPRNFDEFRMINWLNPDLEDAIPDKEKDVKRNMLLDDFPSVKRFLDDVRPDIDVLSSIRINKPSLGNVRRIPDYGLDDLKAFLSLPNPPDVLVVPKINSRDELDRFVDLCEKYEKQTTPLFLIIESLSALSSMDELISHERVFGAVLGVHDLLLDFFLRQYFIKAKSELKINKESFFSIQDAIKRAMNLISDSQKKLYDKLSESQKLKMAPASFTNHFETSLADLDYLLDQENYNGRTGIHPNQFPSGYEDDTLSSQKLEKLFIELPAEKLIEYLNLVTAQDKPGYFAIGDTDGDATYPNLMGKPIVKYMALLLALYLDEEKRCGAPRGQILVSKIEAALKKANEKGMGELRIAY